MSQFSIYWHYDAYVSFRHTAIEYIQALRHIGQRLCYEPYEADIVILQGSVETINDCYRVYPELHNRYVIGFVQWEADELPLWMANILQRVDEIWTSSDFCANVYRKYHKNVYIIPHIIQPPSSLGQPTHWFLTELAKKTDSKSFFFYSIINKIEPRKNLGGIVDAFRKADFGEECFLIIKTGNLQKFPSKLRSRKVFHLSNWHTEREMSALHASAHVYISAHRGEGWGLGMSEAMAHGNIVIATNYGGNKYYMNSKNSLLIDYDLRTITPEEISVQPHLWTRTMKWAEIKQDQLVEAMKFSYYQYNNLEKMRQQAVLDMRKFSVEPIAHLMKNRLMKIRREIIS